MKSPRRRLATAAAIAVISGVLLAGCASQPQPKASDSRLSGDITVAVLKSPGFNDCIASVADGFKRKTGVTVNLSLLPYAAMFDKYVTGFSAGGSTYDLVNVAFQWTGQFADAGFIEPLNTTGADSVDGIAPELLKQYQYAGKLYAIPYNSSVFGFVYRTDIFKDLGLSFPKTLPALDDTLRTLDNAPSLKAAGIRPISIMGASSKGMANFNGLYRGFGGPALEDRNGKATAIDQAAAAKAFTSLKAQAIQYSPAGALQATDSTTPAQFTNGTVAMEAQYSTAFGSSLDSSTSKVKGKYAFATAPGGHGDLGGWGFAVPTTAHNPKAAQAFANYLASPAVDKSCAVNFGREPVRTADFSDPEVLKAIPYLPQVRTAVKTAVERYKGPKAGAENDIVNSVTANFLSGQISSAEEAARTLSQQIKAAAK